MKQLVASKLTTARVLSILEIDETKRCISQPVLGMQMESFAQCRDTLLADRPEKVEENRHLHSNYLAQLLQTRSARCKMSAQVAIEIKGLQDREPAGQTPLRQAATAMFHMEH